jgi:hypothetical protein
MIAAPIIALTMMLMYFERSWMSSSCVFSIDL